MSAIRHAIRYVSSPPAPPTDPAFLLETGFYILLETGFKLLLE